MIKKNNMAKKRNIKGPTSALTDFLQEHGIVAKDLPKGGKKGTEVDVIYSEEPVVKKRRTFTGKQIELVNRENYFLSDEFLKAEKFYENFKSVDFSKENLKIFIFYLWKTRKLNQEIFNEITKFGKNSLEIFDCSEIYDFSTVKNFSALKFNLCGKLKNEQLNLLFKNNSLEILKINGGYLLHNFTPPTSLAELDVSYCTRLTEEFFTNLKIMQLKKLNFSFNLNLKKDYALPMHIDVIYAEETFISEKILHNFNLKKIKTLNVNRCINFSSQYDFSQLKNIMHLEVEGLSKINLKNLSIKIKKLNISRTFDCKNISHLKNLKNLEELNLSFLNLTERNLSFIFHLKNLTTVNFSGNLNITEDFVKKVIEKCPAVKKILVFGCFNLTEELAEFAWENYKRVEIIGNPLETRYLLN